MSFYRFQGILKHNFLPESSKREQSKYKANRAKHWKSLTSTNHNFVTNDFDEIRKFKCCFVHES